MWITKHWYKTYLFDIRYWRILLIRHICSRLSCVYPNSCNGLLSFPSLQMSGIIRSRRAVLEHIRSYGSRWYHMTHRRLLWFCVSLISITVHERVLWNTVTMHKIVCVFNNWTRSSGSCWIRVFFVEIWPSYFDHRT